MRWIPVEEVQVGDELIAFDEYPAFVKTNGQPARRKWRIATVLRSTPRNVDCVRVHLANGESVVCTPEHPWLAQRYTSGGNGLIGGYAQWVQTRDLITSNTYTRRVHGKWMEIPKKSTGWWVHKQLDVWDDDKSYEAGWLAGMFDGEGSLAFGTHGSPKLSVTQVEGEIIEQVQAWLRDKGFSINTLPRTDVLEGRQPMVNVYVNGGFPGILKALGTLRPRRLIGKLDKLDLASRSIQAEKVRVTAVEPAGKCNIQEIETSTGTYIGEGYLHHNCYGNRMADHHEAKDGSIRNTYRHVLGRPLHPSNTGQYSFGYYYQNMHHYAWKEVYRVLKPNGIFVLNLKNFYKKGEVVDIISWHKGKLYNLGFTLVEEELIPLPGNRFGQNGSLRVREEWLGKFVKEE